MMEYGHVEIGHRENRWKLGSSQYFPCTTDEDIILTSRGYSTIYNPSLEKLSTHKLRSILWASNIIWMVVPT
jgi:hypothetical protein